jgi:hypothetical protein
VQSAPPPVPAGKQQQTIGSDLVYAEGGSAWVKATDDPILSRLFQSKDDVVSGAKAALRIKRTTRRTQNLAITLMFGMVVVLFILLGWLVFYPIPTTTEIDADLNQVRSEIKRASTESADYASGLLKSLIEIRRQTFEDTEAMLLQKKASLLRRVSLSYSVEGKQLIPANDDELKGIKEEIAQAEQKVAQSKKNAEKYSGGLVQGIALMTVETDCRNG